MKILIILVLALTIGCKPNNDAAGDKAKSDTPVENKQAENKQAEAKPIAKKDTLEAKKEEPNDMPASVAKKQAPFPDPMKPGDKTRFGAEFAISGDPQPLAKLVKAGGSTAPVKVSGKIKSVCKKKGCWFTIGDEGIADVRVRMKDYGFFVPKNSDGGDAVIEGVLKFREVPQAEAQHYADDAAKPGETPEKIEGPQKVFEFTATAVEISKA